jgi:hypothetical protein
VKEKSMPKIGLLVRIEVNAEYADQMECALRGAQQLVEQSRRLRLGLGRAREIAQTMAGSAPVISEVNLLGIKAPEDHEPQPFDKRLGINSIPEMPALTGVEPRSSKETT